MFRTLKNGLAHLIFPHVCATCQRPIHAQQYLLCISCDRLISKHQEDSLTENLATYRLAGRFPFVYAYSYAPVYHSGVMLELIHLLKYKGRTEIGHYFGDKIAKILPQDFWEDVTHLLPVPLHIKKQHQRGYNQAKIIAEGIQKSTKIPIVDDYIYRVVNTDSQTHKNREERIQNVSEAFSIKKHAPENMKHVVIVDDVLTTGATIEACARLMLNQNPIKLSVITIGIASN